MNYCKDVFLHYCNDLIKYCMYKCNFTNDDDMVPYTKEHICYCNCTNQDNYNQMCLYDNTSRELVALIAILFGVIGIFVICSICRTYMFGCIKSQNQSHHDLENNRSLPGYSYNYDNRSVITAYSLPSRSQLISSNTYLATPNETTISQISQTSQIPPDYIEIDLTQDEHLQLQSQPAIIIPEHIAPPPYLSNYLQNKSLSREEQEQMLKNDQVRPPQYHNT